VASMTDIPALDEDVPPPGSPCIVCRATGHFCAASRYLKNTDDGICLACLQGRNCSQTAAKMRDEQEEGDHLISEALRQDILTAPAIESDESIGDRTGISAQYVSRIRKQAGIVGPRTKCSIDGCENFALKNYSFCPINHGKELRTEQYDLIVAKRKLEYKSRKPKAVPKQKPLKTEPYLKTPSAALMEAFRKCVDDEGAAPAIGTGEIFKDNPVAELAPVTMKVSITPVSVTSPYDVAISSIQTEIHKLTVEVEKLQTALTVLESLKGGR
jgi:hypothetical protein